MDKSSKNNNTEIQLRKINREIWWLETKIDWLRFVSTGHGPGKMTDLFLIILAFVIYVVVGIFLMKQFGYEIRYNKSLHISFVVILFFISCYCSYLLSKEMAKKLKFLDKKLIILYKKRRNISDKLKT